MDITVGTFNVNNLFSRYNFEAEVQIAEEGEEGIQLNANATIHFAEPISYILRIYEGRLVEGKPEAERLIIANRIKAMNVDVLALQEVEDIGVLREFALNDLGGMYPYQVLVEGNDPRLIDLGLLSKYPIGGVSSWQHAVHKEEPSKAIFSRDLLEVEILNERRTRTLLTVYNNHLKSHFLRWDEDTPEAREAANERRRRQADKVAEIVQARMRPSSRFVIVGDLNDPPDSEFLAPLVQSQRLGLANGLLEPQETRPTPAERAPSINPPHPAWTYRFKDAGLPATHQLYDQIWLSPTLAARQQGAWIDRRTKLTRDGSDHDPAWVQLRL